MSMKKIAITVDENILLHLDSIVSEGLYPNRSKIIQAAIDDKLLNLQKTRLFVESAKLSKSEEQAIAEGLGSAQ